MSLSALLLALAQDPAPAPPVAQPIDRLAQLAPRARVAGLVGFQCTSSITFDDPASRPHTLETTYVFPDRARWQLTPADAAPGERHVVFRCGTAFFELPSQQPRATLVSDKGPSDENWRASLASLEMRRALFLWPDGFAWEPEGDARRAELPSGEHLEVELGSDGRPSAIFVAGARDERETLRSITWRESRGRWWPSTMELCSGGVRVWRERVETLETEVRVLDLYFLPPELRPAGAAGDARPAHADVPACHWLRIPLPPGTDWAASVQRGIEAAQAHSKAPPTAWKLEGGSSFELGKLGEPTAILLRFTPGSDPPPEGLVKVREHAALTIATPGAGPSVARALEAARTALPPSCAAGLAYVRFPGPPAPDVSGQVFLALVARD